MLNVDGKLIFTLQDVALVITIAGAKLVTSGECSNRQTGTIPALFTR